MPRLGNMTSLLLAFALAGCGQTPTADAGTSAEPVSARPSLSASTTEEPAPVSQDPGQEQPKNQYRKIEYRQFQLDDLEVAEVKFEDTVFKLWVMDTDLKRAEGMMFLQDGDFKPDEGMVFAFKEEQFLSFWMRNTLVPLDIAYCDAKGKVVTTYTMKALDETSDYSSKAKAKFVIELKAGTIKKLKIDVGDRFEIPETVVAKD